MYLLYKKNIKIDLTFINVLFVLFIFILLDNFKSSSQVIM